MKKLILSAVIICMAAIYTFSQSSKVTMFSQNGEKFWVIVNGEKKNQTPQTKVVIENLTAPNYKFKIIFEDSKLPSLDKTITTKNVDEQYGDFSYVIRMNDKGSQYVIRLNSQDVVTTTTTTTTTTAPANSSVTNTTNTKQPNQTQSNTQITRQTTTSSTNTDKPQNTNMGVGISVNETKNGVNMNVNMDGMEGMNMNTGVNTTGTITTSATTTTTTTTTTSNSGNNLQVNNPPNQNIQNKPLQQPAYVMPGYSGPTGCPLPMSDENFSSVKQSVSSKSFEDSKLTIAKQVVRNNCLLCSQVKEIMKLFSFEDSRLDFAKFAYKYTFDIGNYYQLNDAFQFESSIDELNQYISSGGR